MTISVYGILKDRAHVATTTELFQQAGYRDTDIAVLYPSNNLTQEFAHEHHTKLPEGFTYGTIIGGTLGILFCKGVSRALGGKVPANATSRSLMQDLFGGYGLGALLGSAVGAALGAQIPEYEAKRYQNSPNDGSILISVHCDDADWAAKAKKILQEVAAKEVSADRSPILPEAAAPVVAEVHH